jgi:hypothetical protein
MSVDAPACPPDTTLAQPSSNCHNSKRHKSHDVGLWSASRMACWSALRSGSNLCLVPLMATVSERRGRSCLMTLATTSPVCSGPFRTKLVLACWKQQIAIRSRYCLQRPGQGAFHRRVGGPDRPKSCRTLPVSSSDVGSRTRAITRLRTRRHRGHRTQRRKHAGQRIKQDTRVRTDHVPKRQDRPEPPRRRLEDARPSRHK